MANIKTYDLLQCSRKYPTVEGANNTVFSTYIDLFVEINSDPQQSYKVKENVQSRFFAPTSADGISDVKYSVTSIKYNGLECMNTVSNLTVTEASNIHVIFPLYLGDPTGYSSSLANAVYTETQAVSAGFFERNFIDFMQGLFDTLGLAAEIRNSHPDWWTPEAFPSMRNFMLETYSSDTLDITMTETYNGVERVLRYVVDGSSAVAYINGVDVTTIAVPLDEQPQFGDVYSINSVPVSVTSDTEIECCPIVDSYYTSLENTCESTLAVDCDCSKITFSDTSNYDNGLAGHDPEFFNHRVITLTRPDGTRYIWSTDDPAVPEVVPGVLETDEVNLVIPVHDNSSNMFEYSLVPSDQDGIYTIEIGTYPDWQSGIYYDISLGNMVYRDGIIYKQVASSTNVDPSTDANNDFWTPVLSTDNRGRYHSEEKIVVLCISLNKCYREAVEKALCDIKYNPCADLCDNKPLLKAMKMRITKDALEFAVNEQKWDLAKEHLTILKNICCCNG
jgi:hypothetical protein